MGVTISQCHLENIRSPADRRSKVLLELSRAAASNADAIYAIATAIEKDAGAGSVGISLSNCGHTHNHNSQRPWSGEGFYSYGMPADEQPKETPGKEEELPDDES